MAGEILIYNSLYKSKVKTRIDALVTIFHVDFKFPTD